MNHSETTSAAGGPLWCMHIQGPDDLHAAPDFWTALAWAAELNSFIAEKAAKGNWKADDNYPLSQAVVRQWTGTPESHAVQCEIELADRAEHEAKRKAAAPTAKGGTDLRREFDEYDITQDMIQAGRYAANLNDGTLARIYLAMRAAEFAASPPPPAGAAGGGSGDLGALSAGASKGPWHVDMFPYRDIETGESEPPQCEGICTHDDEGGLADSIATCNEREAKFIVALVNAYRSGRLIEAPTPDLGTQGEPVAWAFEWMSRGGWVDGISRSHPGSLGTRKVEPLFKQAPRSDEMRADR